MSQSFYARRLQALLSSLLLAAMGCSCSDDHWYNETKAYRKAEAEKRKELEAQGLTPKQAKNIVLMDEVKENTERGASPPPVVLEGEDLKRVVNE